MLYNTHQRFGLLSSLMGIPFFIYLGIIPVLSLSLRFSDFILVSLLLLVSLLSASFGAEFPDCDSYGGIIKEGSRKGEVKKGSIPSQKHPFISKIFKFFNVKHRGKFSHDYVSLFFFFGSIFLLQRYGLLFLQKLLPNMLVGMIFNILSLLILLWISREIAIKYLFNKKIRNRNKNMYLLILGGTFIFLFLITLSIGYSTLNIFSGVNAYKTAVFCRGILNIFVLFTWIGAYSHLFADMITNEGVNFAGKRISPAKLVIAINKLFFVPAILFGALGFYLNGLNGMYVGIVVGVVVYFSISKTDLKTGSSYEDFCYAVITFLCIPMLIITFLSVTGGDVMGFLKLIGILK